MSVSGRGFSLGLLGLLAIVFLAFGAQAGDGAAAGPVSFSDVDQDGNGCISEDEFNQFHSKMHGKGKGYGKGKGQGKGHGHGSHGKGCCAGEGMHGKKMPAFADFDLDSDGSITESELNQGRAKRMSENAAEGRQMKHAADAPGFSDIDSDGDGVISEDEFAAHQAEHRQKMHKKKSTEEQ